MTEAPRASSTSSARPARHALLWTIVRVILAVLGLTAVVVIVREIGLEHIGRVIVPALPWLPLALVLELARIGMDALSSHYTLDERDRVPWLPMYAAHLVAYAVMGVAPAGRASAEAVKAGLLARWIGGGSAAALGTANQANTLLSSGTYSLICAGAAWMGTGSSLLTLTLLGHVVGMNVSGLVLRGAARWKRLGMFLARRFPRLAPHEAAFLETSRATSIFPLRPVLAMMSGRALQTVQLAVLIGAVGLTPGAAGALTLHGVYLVAAAVGVLIPGQLGANEGAFALAAGTIGASTAQAASIALLAHVIQLVLVIAGLVVLALWRPSRAVTTDAPSESA